MQLELHVFRISCMWRMCNYLCMRIQVYIAFPFACALHMRAHIIFNVHSFTCCHRLVRYYWYAICVSCGYDTSLASNEKASESDAHQGASEIQTNRTKVPESPMEDDFEWLPDVPTLARKFPRGSNWTTAWEERSSLTLAWSHWGQILEPQLQRNRNTRSSPYVL